MSLTGSAFLTLVVLITVGLFVATVLLWPRLAAPSPWPLLARVGLLLGTNALVLLVAATSMNDLYGFFGDWTDLAGAIAGGPVAIARSRGGATASDAVAASLGSSGEWRVPATLPPLPAAPPGQRVFRFEVTGTSSGLTGVVDVELPVGYRTAADAHRRYPVLETFHGEPSTPAQWIDTMHLGQYLDSQRSAGRIDDAIIVSPQLEFPVGNDTECVNGPAGTPQVERWVSQDVPHWVLTHLRVRTDRQSWSTVGLSAGAWCAAMTTMLHPDRFATAIVMGGYFRPWFSPSYVPFAQTSAAWRRYDLVRLAASRQAPAVALWVETSHSDRTSFPSSQQFLTVARPPLSVDAVVLRHAGHRISLWEALLPQALDWLGATDPGFAPSSSARTEAPVPVPTPQASKKGAPPVNPNGRQPKVRLPGPAPSGPSPTLGPAPTPATG